LLPIYLPAYQDGSRLIKLRRLIQQKN